MSRILLVEDNEFNRDMLSRRLLRRGFQVDMATDGPNALDVARSSPPDVILMDLGLPGMDGLEVVRRLKAMGKTRAIPILALTAHALPADRALAQEAGCNDYDTKPVDMARLLAKIERLLTPQASPPPESGNERKDDPPEQNSGR
jgi:CheY-like chemotaxis protein